MNIKVAIRVRPFNKREEELGSELCVDMNSHQTFLLKENSAEVERTFTFDHCFWSHDSFTSGKGGFLSAEPGTSKYSDQDKVFGVLGMDLLNNAVNGYNCCIFAYGQTGSGKSYSIFGYEGNPGIVPKLCAKLFDGSLLQENETRSFMVSLSMMEIYNERVQDLLIPVMKRPKGGLKIRENNQLGVFVEQLIHSEVTSYEEIEEFINTGSKNKTLGSTLMNNTSSRAHTIITIDLLQKEIGKVKTTQKRSQIHLVDLAGSEKVSKTDATGDRLKEACSINKSLTMLGMVINQLYKKSKGEKIVVSYRDAALTRILQNALGGNSKTCMICAISPSRDNFEETLSTLRYADQAKQIKQNAVINESDTDKLIKQLLEENERLKQTLAQMQNKSDARRIEDVGEQLKELEYVISQQTALVSHDFGQRESRLTKSTLRHPVSDYQQHIHMHNLNEDPLLDRKIIYDFEEVRTLTVTRNEGLEQLAHQKTLVLNGIGIFESHCVIELIDGELWIHLRNPEAGKNTFLNGTALVFGDNELSVSRRLEDTDRLIFGTSSTFLVRHPLAAPFSSNCRDPKGVAITWEYCQLEKFHHQENAETKKVQQKFEDQERRLREQEQRIKASFESEKKEFLSQMDAQKQEHEKLLLNIQQQLKEKEAMEELDEEFASMELMRAMQSEQKTKELEFQIKLNAIQKEAQQLRQMQTINEELEKKLINYYHKIKEANFIAQELNRNIEFVPFVASLNLLSTLGGKSTSTDLVINVKVINYEEGWANYWDLEKFDNRLVLIRETLEHFFTYNKISYSQSNDPFWDPEEFFLYGQCFCLQKNVLYRFEMTHKVGILGYEGDIGFVMVSLVPIDDQGGLICEEDMEEEIEEPDDLIIKQLSCHFRVNILQTVFYDVSKLLGKRGYFSFEVMSLNGLETFSTNIFKINDNQTEVSYTQWVKLPRVTTEIIDYYINKNLQIKFFIEQIEQIPVKGKNTSPVINRKRGDTALRDSSIFQSILVTDVPDQKFPIIKEESPVKFQRPETEHANRQICSVM